MTFIFIILALAIFATIGYCGWSIWKENQPTSPPESAPEKAEHVTQTEGVSFITPLQNFLNRLKPKKFINPDAAMSAEIKPSLKTGLDQLRKKFINDDLKQKWTPKKFGVAAENQDNGTADLRLDDVFSKQETVQPEKTETGKEVKPPTPKPPEVKPEPPSLQPDKTEHLTGPKSPKESAHPESPELTNENRELENNIRELQQKNEQLEKLFAEKSQILKETEETLTSEMQARKEFNKVKDLLDKELKDTKDRCRDLEMALANAQAESKSHLTRIQQLEEKLVKSEKGLSKRQKEFQTAQQAEDKDKADTDELSERLDSAQKEIRAKDQKIHDLVDHLKDQPSQTASETPPPPKASQEKQAADETEKSTPEPESKEDEPSHLPPLSPADDQKPSEPSTAVYVKPTPSAETPPKPPQPKSPEDEEIKDDDREGEDNVSLAPDILSEVIHQQPEEEETLTDEGTSEPDLSPNQDLADTDTQKHTRSTGTTDTPESNPDLDKSRESTKDQNPESEFPDSGQTDPK